MSNLKIDTIVVGPIQTNCYIVWNESTKEALVFDPGDQGVKIYEELQKRQLTLKAIFLTHGHFDHMNAAAYLVNQTHARSYISREEERLVTDPNLNCSILFGQPSSFVPDEYVKDNDILFYLDTQMKVMSTPGHTAGSVCYYFEEDSVLISGDTLFFESCGRTDFPTGNAHQMRETLELLLTKLKEDVVVYPGHGCSTSIGYEKKNNPYL